MDEQNRDEQHPGNDAALDRRTFLSTTAKVAAGVAGAGALISANPAGVLAERARLRSLNLRSKATATLTMTINGDASAQTVFNKLAARFHAQNPTITVNPLLLPTVTWSDYFEKVLTLVAGGRAPDIIRIATEGSRLFGAKDLAYPLDSFIKRDAAELGDYFNDVSPKLVDIFKYNGKQIALPFEWNNMVIFYNTALFKKAGITPPGPDWTGDDFRAVATKLRSVGAYGFNCWAAGTFGIVAWMYAAGGDLYNSDWTAPTATKAANIQAMQFLQDLIWKDKTSPKLGSPDFPLLEAGRVGMIGAGRWPVTSFEQANFTSYDVQFFPKLSSGRKTIFGVGAHPIYKNSKYPEEAWKFIKFLSTANSLRYATQLGFSIPSRRSVATDPALMIPPKNFHVYYDSLAAAESIPAPAQFNEVESALNAVYSKMMANEMTPTAMLQSLNQQITSILAKPV
jgi:ABC-type glycerol-3-phosphate transport system substrate-binding protein